MSPERGQVVGFRIGKAFPAEEQLARWMTVCSMALNDTLVVNALLIPRLREEIPSEPGENFYLGRLAGAHLYEAASFLRRSDRIEEISSFVRGLDADASDAYRELLAIGEGGRGAFHDQLKHARNQSFHYQQLFVGDHEEREPLRRALASHADAEQEAGEAHGKIYDVPPPITGFRAIFAYDVATEMLLPGDTEAEYPIFLTTVSEHIAKFLVFVKAALNAYTQTRPEGTWTIEEVDG